MKRNWHAIEGPNGMCACGVTADGTVVTCGRLLEDEIADRLAVLEAHQTALREALLKVTEHMDRAGGDAYAMPECPWCHWQDDRQDHASDCELFQARELLEALALPPAPSPKEPHP